MKKFIAVILLIAMTMGLAACSGSSKTDGDNDLVKVGDTTITDSQLTQYLELTAYVQNIDLTQFKGDSMKAIKSQMLDDLVSVECIKQYYKGKEDKVLPETIDKDFKAFMDQAKGTESIKDFLDKNKISDETMQRFYYDQYYRKAYFDEVKAGMKTLDQDAKEYYDANKDSFKADDVTASHILVKDEATAKDILAKLKAGADFAEMAKQYSIDGSAASGGALGTFGRGAMVKEFEDAAFALKPGEISDVVKSQFGYHIIKVTDKNQGTKTYDDVKDSIIENLVSQEALKKINDLKSNAKVKYLTDEYKANTQG
jgi:foldase protein PrsA